MTGLEWGLRFVYTGCEEIATYEMKLMALQPPPVLPSSIVDVSEDDIAPCQRQMVMLDVTAKSPPYQKIVPEPNESLSFLLHTDWAESSHSQKSFPDFVSRGEGRP